MEEDEENHFFCFKDFCDALQKPPSYIRSLQTQLGIYIPGPNEKYSYAYLKFMEQIVALRTLNIPVRDISELFNIEVRILEMLHFHTLAKSKTWYLDACNRSKKTPNTLLLTGVDLGFSLTGGEIQSNLDFGRNEPELFSGKEMGEDIKRALDLYLARIDAIKTKLKTEISVLRQALEWSKEAFGTEGL